MNRFLGPLPVALAASAVALACLPTTAGAAPTSYLRLDGIGPLRLGMTTTAAVATGWLGGRRTGCELEQPPPIAYRFTGPKAPSWVSGAAEFAGGRLRTLSFTRGVRTGAGVTVGRTAPGGMVSRYRAAGFSASMRFVPTFQGTFVTVKRRGRDVIGGFSTGGRVSTLAIPYVPVCE